MYGTLWLYIHPYQSHNVPNIFSIDYCYSADFLEALSDIRSILFT